MQDEDGQTIELLKGGRGGLGNWQFRTATRQTPRFAQPGEPAVEKNIILELKLLADVGLVGFPNAGKSTLLSALSSARPKIANYPFTTMEPNLGIVEVRDGKSFVMADIPGIIEGASEGRGLGLRFLRHIERNSLLLFLIPIDADDINKEYNILLGELEKFNPQMLDKPSPGRALPRSRTACGRSSTRRAISCAPLTPSTLSIVTARLLRLPGSRKAKTR